MICDYLFVLTAFRLPFVSSTKKMPKKKKQPIIDLSKVAAGERPQEYIVESYDYSELQTGKSLTDIAFENDLEYLLTKKPEETVDSVSKKRSQRLSSQKSPSPIQGKRKNTSIRISPKEITGDIDDIEFSSDDEKENENPKAPRKREAKKNSKTESPGQKKAPVSMPKLSTEERSRKRKEGKEHKKRETPEDEREQVKKAPQKRETPEYEREEVRKAPQKRDKKVDKVNKKKVIEMGSPKEPEEQKIGGRKKRQGKKKGKKLEEANESKSHQPEPVSKANGQETTEVTDLKEEEVKVAEVPEEDVSNKETEAPDVVVETKELLAQKLEEPSEELSSANTSSQEPSVANSSKEPSVELSSEEPSVVPVEPQVHADQVPEEADPEVADPEEADPEVTDPEQADPADAAQIAEGSPKIHENHHEDSLALDCDLSSQLLMPVEVEKKKKKRNKKKKTDEDNFVGDDDNFIPMQEKPLVARSSSAAAVRSTLLPEIEPTTTIIGLSREQIFKMKLTDVKIKTILSVPRMSKMCNNVLQFAIKETEGLFADETKKTQFVQLCVRLAVFESQGFNMSVRENPEILEWLAEYNELSLKHTRTNLTVSSKQVHQNDFDYSVLSFVGHILIWANHLQLAAKLHNIVSKYGPGLSQKEISASIGGYHLWDRLRRDQKTMNTKRWKHIQKFRLIFDFEVDQFVLILRFMNLGLEIP